MSQSSFDVAILGTGPPWQGAKTAGDGCLSGLVAAAFANGPAGPTPGPPPRVGAPPGKIRVFPHGGLGRLFHKIY